jgi:hypothetical protein
LHDIINNEVEFIFSGIVQLLNILQAFKIFLSKETFTPCSAGRRNQGRAMCRRLPVPGGYWSDDKNENL